MEALVRPAHRWGRAFAFPYVLLVMVGCHAKPSARAEAKQEADAALPQGTVVDSIFPIEEEIRRFRASLPEIASGPSAPRNDQPAGLIGGASSRDGLVRRWIRALEAVDTAAIAGMLMTPAEFITLYYPDSKFTRPPYRQSPRLLWFLMTNASSQGAGRVLERHGGQPFGFVSYACGDTAEAIGAVRVWSDCLIRREADGVPSEMRFFGGIMEHRGQFKFLTYASDY